MFDAQAVGAGVFETQRDREDVSFAPPLTIKTKIENMLHMYFQIVLQRFES